MQQVNILEKRLGFPIFNRDYSGVTLTRAGGNFLTGAAHLLGEYETLLKNCRDEPAYKTITVGSLPNLTSVITPAICKEFRRIHLRVSIRFLDLPREEYFRKFSEGAFDISAEYVNNYRGDNRSLLFFKLRDARHYCGVLPGHPLAAKKEISLADLAGSTLMMYRRGITRCDDALRDRIAAEMPGIRVHDIETYDSSTAVRREMENAVILLYSMYWKSFPEFICIPAVWGIPVELGIGCQRNCRQAVRDFLRTAAAMYGQKEILRQFPEENR